MTSRNTCYNYTDWNK